MEMPSITLHVLDGAPLHSLKAEFALVERNELLHYDSGIGPNRWVDMKMVNGAASPTMPGCCDQFTDLGPQVGTEEMTRMKNADLLTVLLG